MSAVVTDPAADFARLGAGVPLLLLPVRIETVIVPGALRVRIYPDRLHADGLKRALSATEIAAGQQFWRAVWSAPADLARRRPAFAALADQLGARRAAWVARATAPANLARQVQSVAAGAASVSPIFPAIAADERPAAVSVRLLPARWVAIGFRGGARVFTEWGRPIDPARVGGLDAGDASWATGEVNAAMRWMVDYPTAVAVGMAITVPLTGPRAPVATGGLSELWVLGVGDGDGSTVADVLAAQSYVDGASFIAAGTPTNNTDTSTSSWTGPAGDADQLLALVPPAAPPVTDPAAHATRLARALGLTGAGVLGELPGGGRPDDARGAAMNRVLWHCTFGPMLRQLLAGETERLVSDETVQWIEDWFVSSVRGAGPLPALQLGPHPYGILPVRYDPSTAWPANVGDDRLRRLWIASLVGRLAATWDAALTSVPRLDPDASTSGDGAADAALVDFLSLNPDPVRLTVRTLELLRDDVIPIPPLPVGVASYYRAALEFIRGKLQGSQSAQRLADLGTVTDIDSQISFFATLLISVGLERGTTTNATLAANLSAATGTIGYLLDVLREHSKRVTPFRSRVSSSAVTGEVPTDDPRIFYSLYHDDAATWNPEWLVERPDAAAGNRARSYLSWLAGNATAPGVAAVRAGHPPDLESPRPLLYLLARNAVLRAAEAPPATVTTGTGATQQTTRVTVLSRVAAARRVLQPLDRAELEQRLGETLGLASHRLDAWNTSLATARLEALRAARPAALAVGAWGVVLDLRPDSPLDRTQGYVHAPSLGQAVTAAVLRSGWLAHRNDDATPFAIDLSSDRIRRAAWLLDGVRRGLALSELLGARFERCLHDATLDVVIDDLRAAASDEPLARRRTIDGLALLDGWDGAAVQAVRTALDTVARGRLDSARRDLVDTLDAVADAVLAEGVHQLLHGDPTRAAATLDAVSSGDVAPPELELPRTVRDAVTVTHRLMVLLPVSPPGGVAPTSERARIAPDLERWAVSVLGDPSTIGLTLRFSGAGAPAPRPVSLTQLGIGALDLVAWAPAEDDGRPAEIADRVQAWQARQPDIAPLVATLDLQAFTKIPLADSLLLAGALRRLLGRARAADGRDLGADRSATVDGIDRGAADGRARDGQARLTAARDGLARALATPGSTPTALAAAMAPLGGWLAGAILPASTPAEALRARAAALLRAARRRLRNVMRAPDAADKLEALAGFPVTLSFVVADAATVAASLAASATRQGEPLAALGWLDQVARVQAGAARMQDVVMLAEAQADTRKVDLAVMQFPHEPGEGWAATSAPAARRVNVVAWTADSPTIGAGVPLAGLVFDEWTERVPKATQVTGLAFAYDAPASRTPAAALLAVLPEDGAWSLDHVLATVRDTLAWIKRRGVDPERLDDLGHYLPAIFSSASLRPEGDAEVA